MNCDFLISQQIVINGRKWWISGAGDPRNAVHLVMGKSDTSAPKHFQQSIVIVPSDTPGVKLIRPMQVFGYDELSNFFFFGELARWACRATLLILGLGFDEQRTGRTF